MTAEAITARASRVAAIPLCLHAVATTPAGLMEPIRSYRSASVGLPLLAVGRLLHCTFRGLLSVYSRYGLHARQVAYATLYTRGSDDFVSSVAALIATGWSEPAPGRDFHPLRNSAFHGAPQACAMAWLQHRSSRWAASDSSLLKNRAGGLAGPMFLHSQSLCRGLGAGSPATQGIALRYS